MRLVTVAHGTRRAAGNRVAVLLTRAAGAGLGIPSVASYVELCPPLFADVVAATDEPTVVVPLLLSTGHHIRHDLPAALHRATGEIRAAPPLGPDPLLATAQAARLLEAGARPGQPVVLVAAGSTDPAAEADLVAAAELLGAQWGAPVRYASIAGRGPLLPQVVRSGDAVSPYLLAPGHFATRTVALCRAAGATLVAAPIGAHPRVVDLVIRRAGALLIPATRAA
jgi:sirohydrochlorin ferrochelatase